ncbi:hypothetical protein GOODEAATRI_019011, partial [Goodea atripinnis]
DLERARQYHQNQLEIAQELQDRAAQGRASSNLGNLDWSLCCLLEHKSVLKLNQRRPR